MLRWLKTVVVSDREKARSIASGGDQEDVPEAPGPGTPGRACAVEASKLILDGIEIGGPGISLEMSLAGAHVPGQAVPGVEAA